MLIEQFRWLAGVIAAHEGRSVVGRTRLQKTVYLLQRKGLPTDFSYSLHFYGPYSDGLNMGLRLVRQFGLAEEKLVTGAENEYYTYQATPEADLPELEPHLPRLRLIQATADVPLELAATYDAFRRLAYPHAEALEALRRKKGAKCTPENEAKAFDLLRQLNLPAGV